MYTYTKKQTDFNVEARERLLDKLSEAYSHMMSRYDFECMTNTELGEWSERHRQENPPGYVRKPRTRTKKFYQDVSEPPVYKFVERDGYLMRQDVATGRVYACGRRVEWNGRETSASIVLHYLRTGETVTRVPKLPVEPVKRYRAQIRVNGSRVSLGMYSNAEERDQAIFMHRLGLTPTK